MRLKSSIIACAALSAVLLGASSAQSAQLANGSFEGVLDDWTANPTLVAIPYEFNHRDALGAVDHTFMPIDGWRMAALMANQPLDAQEGDLPVSPTTLVQTFSTAGGWFSGWAAFLAQDEVSNNDYAFVRLYRIDAGIQPSQSDPPLFQSDVQTVGAYGYTPWTRFYTWLAAGEYTVEAGIGNGHDNFNTSFLLLDGFNVTATIPEPTTWAMMILGFFGLGGLLRRRRALAAA